MVETVTIRKPDLSKVTTFQGNGYMMNIYNLNSWNIFTSIFLSRNKPSKQR